MMISAEGYGLVLQKEEGCSAAPATGIDQVAALVPLYGPLLFRVAHAALRNRAEADDVVQEAFVRVLRHRGSLDAVLDMRVWLVRIVWNLALDRRRRNSPLQMDEAFAQTLAAADAPADRALDEARRLSRVLAEMEKLPKAERHVLLLTAIEEMSTHEVAAVLGKSDSAVRALLFRARTRLKERLQQQEKRREKR